MTEFSPRGDDRQLLPFLPMIYVAWADGVLSADELTTITEQTGAHLTVECRKRLASWLDPENPPSPRQLAAMLRVVRTTAPELEESHRLSLADLGRRLADADGAPVDSATGHALAELEAALGVVGEEATAELLAPERSEPDSEEPEPPFAVDAMTALLDGEHAATRRQVRDLLAEDDFAPLPRPIATDEHRDRVLKRTRALADRGLGALSFPEQVGGAGDVGRFIAVFDTLAYGDLSVVVKFGVQFGLFGGSILQLGTEQHHRRYLPEVGSLALPGCFAMSETGHGSNVRDLETTATYDRASDEFVVHTPHPLARKDWIGNAARHGRLATVFAQLVVPAEEGRGEEEHHGVHAFLVPIRGEDGRPLPGISIEDCGYKEGLNGVDNGRIAFDRVRVPRQNLLDRFGRIDDDGRYQSPIPGDAKRFFTMLGTLVGGRVSVASAAVAASKVALATAIRYGARRRQFGPAGEAEVAILDYQAHQRRLMPRLAAAYAHHFAVRWLAGRYADETTDARETETLAAGIKALATWETIDSVQTCRECCGGQGYLWVNRFAALKADTDVFATFEGDNTVLLQLVSRALLSEYKKRFSDMKTYDLVGFLIARAATEIGEKNPWTTHRTSSDHLRDPELHAAAFRYRERSLLASVARRLKKRLDDGMDSFVAFNQCQDHLLALARAHVERVVLDRFQEAVAAEPGPLADTLGRLAALWALWRIEKDVGWWLENGYVEGNKAAAVRDEVLALSAELRPHAVPLVDAFAVPRQWLGPIAFGVGTERV